MPFYMRSVTFDGIRYKIFDGNGGAGIFHIERVPNSDHFEKMTVDELTKYVAAVVRDTTYITCDKEFILTYYTEDVPWHTTFN